MTWLPRRTVIVPIDFSDDSFASLEAAREMVEDTKSIHVLHVLPAMEAAYSDVIWYNVDDESRLQHAKAAIVAELEKRSWHDMTVDVVIGDPGHEIAYSAEKMDAGLVVIASHGKGGFKHLFLGSVAERVVRLAHCPVLVLKHK
jgi:nucleotide-binding universal stress UspA family protein